MKNYEQMAHDVLTRRDAEIKRRRRAFLIGAPCAAAALVGVVGIGTAVASSNRGKHINLAVTTAGSGSAADANSGAAEIADTLRADDSSVSSETAIDVPEIGSIDIATEDDPPVSDYTNPNVGQNDIKVLDIDEFNIDEKPKDFSGDTFVEETLEELDRTYGLRFDILGQLHPDWELSYDKLGIYYHDSVNHEFATRGLICSRNTLNYTTSSGAKITVSAQYEVFQPISDERLTYMKPNDPSKYKEETVYDDEGNPIGILGRPIDPNDLGEPEPDEGVSTVNGYEALIYRDADGNFLADLDMMPAQVRITAEGLSEEEFLNVLDSFTR